MRKRAVIACMLAVLLVLSAGLVADAGSTAMVRVNGDVNVRSGAGTTFSVVLTAHKGDSFETTGSTKDSSGRVWYAIKAGSRQGFIAGWLVTYISPSKPSSPSTPASPKPTATRYAVAIENGTSIRSGAGVSRARIGVISARTSLRILGESKDSSGKIWYSVDCTALKLSQKMGYVASWVVRVQTAATPPTTSTVPGVQGISQLLALWHPSLPRSAKLLDASNLRNGPSVVYDRLAVLAPGTAVRITGYALNDQKETWCQVDAAGKTGWIYAPLTSSWEKVSNSLVTATVGKTLKALDASAQGLASPFSGKASVTASLLQGKTITGVAVDGKNLSVELGTGSTSSWIEVSGKTAVGGAGSGGTVSSLSGIELVTTNNWTEVLLHIDGSKTGLSVRRLHQPERVEVSLPHLVQPAKTGISGIPTRQVKSVQVWSSSGFVAKIVVYLADAGVELRQSVTGTSVQLLLSTAGSSLPAKSVFLQNELLSSSNETFFSQGTTFMPLVDLANAYGVLLSWDAVNQQTSFTIGNRQYILKDGLRTLKIAQGSNRWNETMSTAPKIMRGLLYVPVGTLCHIFGLELSGDILHVYLDPIVTSLTLTGANASSPSGVITITATESLKITKSVSNGYATFALNGVPAASTIGHESLVPWMTVSVQPRTNDVPPVIKLQIHTTDSVAEVQTPGTGVYKIALSKSSTMGKLEGKKIVLDPGHGYMLSSGHFDTGATGPNGTKESSINLAIALKTKKLLEEEGAAVLLTRSDDSSKTNPDLTKQVQLANAAGADLFLAINQNASEHVTDNGSEVNYWFDRSEVLAALVRKHLALSPKRKDLGVQKSALYLISHIDTMPAVQVECAFISNGEEELLLRQEAFQQKIAQSLADAITEYFSK